MAARFLSACFLLFLLLYTTFPCAAASPPLVLHETTASSPLASHIDILEDKTGKLTIDEVSSPEADRLFKPPVQNRGFTKRVYWLRFTIENKAEAEQRWLLELNAPNIGHLDLYVPAARGGFDLMQAGAMRPMSIRKFQHRTPVFPVVIDGQSKTFFLRGDANRSALLSLTAWSPDAFSRMDHRSDLIDGCYFGAILVMFAYNLFIFLSLRDRSYLYYILDIFCFALYVFFIKGFLVEFVSAGMPSINRYAFMLHVPVILSGLLFCRAFLDTVRNAPLIDRIIKIFMLVALLSIPAILVVPPDIWKRVMAVVSACSSLLLLSAGVVCLAAGYRPARYFVAARFFRVCGVITFVLVAFNVLPRNLLTLSSLQVGSIFEVLLLSFALADRINIMRREKEQEMLERIKLEHEILHISEDERRRISHDLHDGLCQQLTGARLHCSVLEEKLAGEGSFHPELAQLSSLLEASVDHAYDLSRGLWPVEQDSYGLGHSLEELTRRLADSSGIDILFRQERGCEECTIAGATQLYRITQEAITNAVKHARASRIDVALTCQGHSGLSLAVRDNGIGRAAASATKGGLGMGIMAHRARVAGGSLTVSDAEGGGTLFTCIVPCDAGLTEKK
jgi:signal transduction histidine kinase